MAQKVNKPARAPIIMTITLPDEEDKLLRTGQILIQRDTLATFRQFEYGDLGDIMTAIQDSATWLTQVEENPPDLTPAALHPQEAAAAPAQAQSNAQDAGTAQDEESEATEASEQSTGDTTQTSTAPASVQAEQPSLF